MKTITLDTIKAMNTSTFSVQDNSPRGVKTVTAEEIKPGDRIYSMDEFDEIFSNTKPWEIARACFYSRRFNPSDSWFWFNAYGNTESADYISDHDDRSPIDLDEVAEYIVSNDNELFNDDIRAILDGEEVRA